MADFDHENRKEEDRCLNEFKSIIKGRRNDSSRVGAIIIEPITSFGYHQATPYFYKQISAIANEERIPLIIDENQTGVGISGKIWAH